MQYDNDSLTNKLRIKELENEELRGALTQANKTLVDEIRAHSPLSRRESQSPEGRWGGAPPPEHEDHKGRINTDETFSPNATANFKRRNLRASPGGDAMERENTPVEDSFPLKKTDSNGDPFTD